MASEPYPPVGAVERLALGEEPIAGTKDPKPIPGKTRSELFRRALVYASLTFIALLFFVPFLWAISTSLKPLSETTSFDLIPNAPTLHAYGEVLHKFNFVRYAGNSLLLAVWCAATGVALATVGGYAFARLRFPGREVLFMAVLGCLMVPDQVRFVPIYQMLTGWHLAGTYTGYWLIRMVMATELFFMRQYFLTIPRDFEEAAKLDNAGYFKTYFRVMLPLAAPAIAAIAIMLFEGTWNDFFWALVVIGFGSPDHYTLPLGIAQFKFQYQTLWPELMAASIVATIPIFVIYIFFQRYFVAGAVSSGVKG
jgi:multiple sugar transport system permease protein